MTTSAGSRDRFAREPAFTQVRSGAAILELLTAFNASFPRALTARVPDLEEHAAKLARLALVYAATIDGVVAGFAAFYANDAASAKAYLSHLAVGDGFRRRGVGMALLEHCIAVSRAAGMRAMGLEVDADNLAAIEFYRSSGFTPAGAASPHSCYMVKNPL